MDEHHMDRNPMEQPPDREEIREWVESLPLDPEYTDLIPESIVGQTMNELEMSGHPTYPKLKRQAEAVINQFFRDLDIDPNDRIIRLAPTEFRTIVYRAIRTGAAQVLADIGEGLHERAQVDMELEEMIRHPENGSPTV